VIIDLATMPARNAAVVAWYGPTTRTRAIAYGRQRLSAMVNPSPGAKHFLDVTARTSDRQDIESAIRLLISEIECAL
jgi:hypothetical protein